MALKFALLDIMSYSLRIKGLLPQLQGEPYIFSITSRCYYVQHILDYQILLNSLNLGYISGEVPSYLCTLPTSETDLFPQNLSDLPQSQHP